MKLNVEGIEEGKPVPDIFAFGVFHPESHELWPKPKP